MSERRKMPGWLRVTLFVAVLAVILTAVAAIPLAVGYFRPQPAPMVTTGPRLRVSPSQLFTGELRRIEPHLGLAATGCVKLEPIGLEPGLDIGMRVEIRREGQKPQEMGWSKGLLKAPQEASFSLREITDPDGKKQYQLVSALIADGNSSHTSKLPDFWPPPNKFGPMSWSNQALDESVDLAEKVEVPVWAYFVNDDVRDAKDFQKEIRVERDAEKTTIRFGKDFQERINSSPCALVVSLWWERRHR